MPDKHAPNILLTQRVAIAPYGGERRDCLDQRWTTLLHSLGCRAIAVPNHPEAALDAADEVGADCIILTGGNNVLPGLPDHAPERNDTEQALLEWCRNTGTSVIGICRGLQFMNVSLGGKLSPVEGHVQTIHDLCVEGMPTKVNSFHDYGMLGTIDMANELEIVATTQDGVVEAARHRTLSWSGFMWHPEREMPDAKESREWFAGVIREAVRKTGRQRNF